MPNETVWGWELRGGDLPSRAYRGRGTSSAVTSGHEVLRVRLTPQYKGIAFWPTSGLRGTKKIARKLAAEAPSRRSWLRAVGNTVRHVDADGNRGRPRGVLVVGPTLTCHFWINILPLAHDPLLSHYITVDDLRALGPRLYVRPAVIPSFLVLDAEGFPVDWFPAPLDRAYPPRCARAAPRPGVAADPLELTAAVRTQLASYERTTTGQH